MPRTFSNATAKKRNSSETGTREAPGYALSLAQNRDGIAKQFPAAYNTSMIRIRFPDTASERRAVGYLAGRFSFKSWANGDTVVPPAALAPLALEGIPFSVVGPATYEQYAPTVRDPAAPAV